MPVFGAYRNTETGIIVIASVDEGKLILRNPTNSHSLRPVSQTEFWADGFSKLHVRFTRSDPKGLWTLKTMSATEHRTDTFEQLQRVLPSPTQLAKYTGEFYSEELLVTYRLTLRDGHLAVTRGRLIEKPLERRL